MKGRITFTNNISEVIVIAIIFLSLIENIWLLMDQLNAIKIFQVFFMLIILYLYYIEEPKFIVAIKVWGVIVFFISGMLIVSSLFSTTDDSLSNSFIGIIGASMGFSLYYIASEYIKIEYDDSEL